MDVSFSGCVEDDDHSHRFNGHIDDDLKTDREEFFVEQDKDDLANKLQEEFNKSAKGKWHMLQRLFTTGQLFIKHAHPHQKSSSHFNPTNQEEDNMTPTAPSRVKKTVIPVHPGKQNGFQYIPIPSSIKPKQTSKVKFDARYLIKLVTSFVSTVSFQKTKQFLSERTFSCFEISKYKMFTGLRFVKAS